MTLTKLDGSNFLEQLENENSALVNSMRKACKKIAPVWPLENFVAVNPYLGLTDKKFKNVAQDLATAGGIQMTLPMSFYMEKLEEGKILREDIEAALKRNADEIDINADDFLKSLNDGDKKQEPAPIATVVDVASQLSGKDWNSFVTSRISLWAASYFDNGQASWAAADKKSGLFASWKFDAETDLTSEIAGLKNFRKTIKSFPNDPILATQKALEMLRIPEGCDNVYFHRLLLKVGGWSAYAARLDWDNELYGGKDGKLIEMLAVLTCWEAGILNCLQHDELNKKWSEAKIILSATAVKRSINELLVQKLILQEAYDLSAQREIINKFKNGTANKKETPQQAKAQAIFCIDVRSEVYRRNLELVDSNIETLGFAGFFAFPIKYVPLAHEHGEAQCPVLLKTGPTIMEELPNQAENQSAYSSRIFKHQINKIWKSFKSGAVTCFSFVSPIGLSYLPKLFTDSFGLTRPVPHPDKNGMSDDQVKSKRISLETSAHNNEIVGIPAEQRVSMAKNALNAMSLTEDFAKYVMIVGHGSTSVNNPHATGLDCGACGGHSGESNARVAAAVLNDRNVRTSLKEDGINIPENTIFLACLHDTTTDEVSIFNEYDIPNDKNEELVDLKKSLDMAGHAARTERSLRMSTEGDIHFAIKARSNDWSQIRPEWGLAGCSSFIVAPRSRTKNLDFGGRSFLHSYEWKKDQGFSILELIMTAPMVVTSWISLQYYASTVDNKNFGSGNKTLHNVTAGVGVLEGYSGDLRVGLPMQSVHDGENYQHEPLRLNVIIEAPIEAMNTILKKHSSVRNLCDNGWLHLLAMDEEGKVSHRYNGNLNWEKL